MAILSKKSKEELRAIYEQEFNEVLTDEEIEEMEIRLLRLIDLLTRKAGK